MRSSPSMRGERADQVVEAARRRRAQALTFWPSRVISRAPPSTSACASATMSPNGRADLGAAGVGHDAIGAEFVAAFLDGEEGARARPAPRRAARRTWRSPACRCRPARAPARGLGDQLGQAVIGLRADDDVDRSARGAVVSAPSAWATQPASAIIGRAAVLARSAGRCPNRPSRPPSRGCGRC